MAKERKSLSVCYVWMCIFLSAMDNRDELAAHGKVREACCALSVSLFGGVTQVESQVFTQGGLDTRAAGYASVLFETYVLPH